MSETPWQQFCRTVVSRIEAIRRTEGFDGSGDSALQPEPPRPVATPPIRRTPKVCAVCGKAFTSIHKSQRFCSHPCSAKGQRKPARQPMPGTVEPHTWRTTSERQERAS